MAKISNKKPDDSKKSLKFETKIQNSKIESLKQDLFSSDSLTPEQVNKARLETLESIVQEFRSNANNFIALSLPIIPGFTNSEKITLTDYLVLSLVISYNINYKFFDKPNLFVEKLLGISETKVEQAFQKLLKLSVISYVDKEGNPTLNKPRSSKEIKNIKEKLSDKTLSQEQTLQLLEEGDFSWNDKRELVFNPRNDIDDINLTAWKFDEETIKEANEEKQAKRNAKIIKDMNNEKWSKIIDTFQIFGININDILKMMNSDEQLKHPDLWGKISKLLVREKLKLIDFYYYLKSEPKYEDVFK